MNKITGKEVTKEIRKLRKLLISFSEKRVRILEQIGSLQDICVHEIEWSKNANAEIEKEYTICGKGF